MSLLVCISCYKQKAAVNITAEQISNLEKIMAEMDRYVELSEMPQERQLSREFHDAIAEASGNDLLVKLYGIVSNAFPDWLLYEALFRKPELLSGSVIQTHDEHTAMLNALKKHDADLAAQASVLHIMESGKWLENYLNVPAKLLREKEKQVAHLIKKTSK